MKVAILDDYQDAVKDLDCFGVLAEHEVTVLNTEPESQSELISQIIDAEALVLIRERTVIDDALLSQLPNLKLISQTGKISNHLDVAACTKHKVAIAEGRGSPIAPSELCWSIIMASSRHIAPYVNNFQNGSWQSSGDLGVGRSLSGLTLGIWGYGKIGQRIAKYATAFGMNVLVWGREASFDKAQQDGHKVAASKAELFTDSDVLSLQLRLNDDTRSCVTASDLALMKKDALIVNTSRAELIEQDALYNALVAGAPGFAAVDVFTQEPASASSEPLLSLPNVLATPHLGYVEKKGYELYFQIAFENVVKFAQGAPENIANEEALS
jgi:D-3-phosphoglycerate dehydrogenase